MKLPQDTERVAPGDLRFGNDLNAPPEARPWREEPEVARGREVPLTPHTPSQSPACNSVI